MIMNGVIVADVPAFFAADTNQKEFAMFVPMMILNLLKCISVVFVRKKLTNLGVSDA
jgi:fumarate hydratase class II